MATMNMVRKYPQYIARPGMNRVVQSNGARSVSLTTTRIELPWLKVASSSSAAAIPEWPPPYRLLRARRRTAAEPFCLHPHGLLSQDGVDPAEIANGRVSSFRATRRSPGRTVRPNGEGSRDAFGVLLADGGGRRVVFSLPAFQIRCQGLRGWHGERQFSTAATVLAMNLDRGRLDAGLLPDPALSTLRLPEWGGARCFALRDECPFP